MAALVCWVAVTPSAHFDTQWQCVVCLYFRWGEARQQPTQWCELRIDDLDYRAFWGTLKSLVWSHKDVITKLIFPPCFQPLGNTGYAESRVIRFYTFINEQFTSVCSWQFSPHIKAVIGILQITQVCFACLSLWEPGYFIKFFMMSWKKLSNRSKKPPNSHRTICPFNDYLVALLCDTVGWRGSIAHIFSLLLHFYQTLYNWWHIIRPVLFKLKNIQMKKVKIVSLCSHY